MGHYIGQLGTTTAAQRPPSFIQTNAINNGSLLDWTIEILILFTPQRLTSQFYTKSQRL